MNIQPIRSGKVRDVYEAGENLVIVASDRIFGFRLHFADANSRQGQNIEHAGGLVVRAHFAYR